MEKLINDFSFGLFFWQAFILLILILLLVKFAWKPIMESITAREEGIKDAIASADNARKEIKNLQKCILSMFLITLSIFFLVV